MTVPARIGIDCRLGGLQHAGIGRYISELVRRLVSDRSSVWVLFCHDHEQARELIGTNPPDNVEVVIVPIRHYSLAEQLQLPGIFSRAQLSLLHVPHFNAPILYNGAYVVTVHDLLWHSHTGSNVTTLSAGMYWIKYVGYRFVTSLALTRARHILVPSQTVAVTVTKTYPQTAKKITITREGIASSLLAQVQKSKSRKRDQRQLLYVGSLYPHKNVELIIRALTQLPDYHLVIISARSVFRSAITALITRFGLKKRVHFVDHASDEKLAEYYASSAALIQPSFSEGFGLTGLEALAFDTPVIASDIPIFREIYQDAAVYASPHAVESLVSVVKQLDDPQVKRSLREKARRVSSQYDWEHTVEQTRALYKSVLRSTT